MDKQLIEYVHKNEFLYNLQHPKYMDNVKKEVAWQDIGDQIKQTGKIHFRLFKLEYDTTATTVKFIYFHFYKPSPLDIQSFGKTRRIDYVLQKRKR